MRTLIIFAMSIALAGQVNAQTYYSDVAVIINQNSAASIEVGTYFQQARNIPNQNLIYIDAPEQTEIDGATFELIKAQVEQGLLDEGIEDQINYLVTTKGLPLKVNYDNTCDEPTGTCFSLGSGLSRCFLATETGTKTNPYRQLGVDEVNHFTSVEYGIYLVTRLDGYSVKDVRAMIDRSGPNIQVVRENTKSVFEIDYIDPAIQSHYENVFTDLETSISDQGWETILDINFDQMNNPPTNGIEDLLLYFIMNYNSIDPQNVNNDWHPGSIFVMGYCWTAATFNESELSGYLQAGDLIRDGASGGKASVNLTYASSATTRLEKALNTYMHSTENYNLAESFYAAEVNLQWGTVILGDPKMSINPSTVTQLDYNTIAEANFKIHPNPSNGLVTINSGETENEHLDLQIFNSMGQLVYRHGIENTSRNIDVQHLGTGIYTVHIISDDERLSQQLIINK